MCITCSKTGTGHCVELPGLGYAELMKHHLMQALHLCIVSMFCLLLLRICPPLSAPGHSTPQQECCTGKEPCGGADWHDSQGTGRQGRRCGSHAAAVQAEVFVLCGQGCPHGRPVRG